MSLALAVALLTTLPASASDPLEVEGDLADRLPTQGQITNGEVRGDTGRPAVVLSLEGDSVEEPIQYDLSEVSDESFEHMMAAAPLAEHSEPGQVAPQLEVGFGWYIYVYLNNDDAQFVVTYGAPALAGLICGIAGGLAAAACSTIAAYIVDNLPTNLPAGQCGEFRFTHGPVPVFVPPANLVTRTC